MIKIPIPENFEFPEMHRIRQQFDTPPVINVTEAVTAEWEKLAGGKWLQPFCTAYLTLFRGTPLLVQLFVVYYGLPDLILVQRPVRYPGAYHVLQPSIKKNGVL